MRHPALTLALARLARNETLDSQSTKAITNQLELLKECIEQKKSDRKGAVPGAGSVAHTIIAGRATPSGTRKCARATLPVGSQFHRLANGLMFSSVGLGTALGPANDEADAEYTAAIYEALKEGVNVIDTSIIYRAQRSEVAISQALRHYIKEGGRRDGVIISTKGGFAVKGLFTEKCLNARDLVNNNHCISPEFICDQIERSKWNLGLETIDIYYIHNPECRLMYESEEVFYSRIREIFTALEGCVERGHIGSYGFSIWRASTDCQIDLGRCFEIARELRGARHSFRFLQIPFNLGLCLSNDPDDIGRLVMIENASSIGLNVLASAPLLQGQLVGSLPVEIRQSISVNLPTDASRAIQYARSYPGISCALVGMRKMDHLLDNLTLKNTLPMSPAAVDAVCGTFRKLLEE